jgi:hypothetical protein
VPTPEPAVTHPMRPADKELAQAGERVPEYFPDLPNPAFQDHANCRRTTEEENTAGAEARSAETRAVTASVGHFVTVAQLPSERELAHEARDEPRHRALGGRFRDPPCSFVSHLTIIERLQTKREDSCP